MAADHDVEASPEVAELEWDGRSLTSFVEGYVELLEELGGQELRPSQIIDPSSDYSTPLAREIAEELGGPIAAAISEGRVEQVEIEQWCRGLRLLDRTSGELRQELQRIHAINRLGRLALQRGLTAFYGSRAEQNQSLQVEPDGNDGGFDEGTVNKDSTPPSPAELAARMDWYTRIQQGVDEDGGFVYVDGLFFFPGGPPQSSLR